MMLQEYRLSFRRISSRYEVNGCESVEVINQELVGQDETILEGFFEENETIGIVSGPFSNESKGDTKGLASLTETVSIFEEGLQKKRKLCRKRLAELHKRTRELEEEVSGINPACGDRAWLRRRDSLLRELTQARKELFQVEKELADAELEVELFQVRRKFFGCELCRASTRS